MNATVALTAPATFPAAATKASEIPSPPDDGRVILACALSSVAMVCLVAAMLYFRITVLRKERTLNAMRRMEMLAERHQRGEAGRNVPGSQSLCGRPVSRSSSTASQLSLSRSWPSGSFRRQFSHPPLSPQSELRQGNLHAIPNGFGNAATTEPLSCFVANPPATVSTRPEFAPSSSPEENPPRRASWSFENPVFDQWVPPLTKSDDEELDSSDDPEVFSPGESDDGARGLAVVNPQLSGDGVSLVSTATDEDAISPGLKMHPRVSRLSGYCGAPLYIRHDDHPLSMPTLHEREDSSSSGGGNEKTTETETTKETNPNSNDQRNCTSIIIGRGRSESSC